MTTFNQKYKIKSSYGDEEPVFQATTRRLTGKTDSRYHETKHRFSNFNRFFLKQTMIFFFTLKMKNCPIVFLAKTKAGHFLKRTYLFKKEHINN